MGILFESVVFCFINCKVKMVTPVEGQVVDHVDQVSSYNCEVTNKYAMVDEEVDMDPLEYVAMVEARKAKEKEEKRKLKEKEVKDKKNKLMNPPKKEQKKETITSAVTKPRKTRKKGNRGSTRSGDHQGTTGKATKSVVQETSMVTDPEETSRTVDQGTASKQKAKLLMVRRRANTDQEGSTTMTGDSTGRRSSGMAKGGQGSLMARGGHSMVTENHIITTETKKMTRNKSKAPQEGTTTVATTAVTKRGIRTTEATKKMLAKLTGMLLLNQKLKNLKRSLKKMLRTLHLLMPMLRRKALK